MKKNCLNCLYKNKDDTFTRCLKCLCLESADKKLKLTYPLWKSKKVMGIRVQMVCYKTKNVSITEEQLNDFLDCFIELVEKKKMYCGGGMKLMDVN